MKISSNKILLLILSFFTAVNNIAKFLPWIVKEFILLVLIMSFTWEYRKMLGGIYIKFTGGLSFTFLLFIYSVLAIFYSNIKFDSIWTIFLIVAFPVVFTFIYGFKYFKKNFNEVEIFYKKFFNEKDYKKFWRDYSLTHGLVRKVNKVVIYSIPGLFAGASVIILFLVLLVLIYTDYLFLVVTFILIISDYLIRKRLFIADSVQRSFGFLQYLGGIKGIFGSILFIIGYFSLGFLIVNYINALLQEILFNPDLNSKLKILLSLLYSPLYPLLTYMLIFHYKLSRRFPKFIQIFYRKEGKKTPCPDLPYGKDKIAISSFIILLVITFYMRFSWGYLWKNQCLLISTLVASAITSILYLTLIFLTIFNSEDREKRRYTTCRDLRKDNLRLPFVSIASSLILSLQIALWGEYDWFLYIYLIASATFLFFIKDLWRKIEDLHLNKYLEETIPFLFYFVIAGVPVFIPSLRRLYFLFIFIEIFLVLAWVVVIIDKMYQ